MADLEGVNGLREDFKVVGQRNLPGKLSYALATGAAKFGVDYNLPNMLHAKFLRSPYAKARVLSADLSKARLIPGVVDILTWEDEDIKNLRFSDKSFLPPDTYPWLDDIADQEYAELALIVVAEEEDICDMALDAIDIEWEILPHVVDIMEGRKKGAPLARGPDTEPGAQALPRTGNVQFSNLLQGDIKAGFDEADHIIEYDLYLPAFASHLPNPPGSLAWWSANPPYVGTGEKLHIEGAVQRRRTIADMYGLPHEMTVHEGLFQGGKYCDWGLRKCQEITPLLSKRTGRPVRCVDTREQTFDFQMNERYMHLKIGFTDEGLITAVEDYSIGDAGSRGNANSFSTYGDQNYGPYYTLKCENISQSMEIVESNRGRMRLSGQHCPFNWDALTVGLYMISEKLGKDPIEISRLNLHGPDSQSDDRPVPSFEACVAEGIKLMDWKPHSAGMRKLPDGRLHGTAFRYQLCPRHAFSGYDCKLELRDGKVHMPTKGPLFGVFAVECNAMVVAEELGLRYEDISIDFDYKEKFTPVGGGADGTTASAWAMKECANILKKQILETVIDEAEDPKMPTALYSVMPEPSPFKGLTTEDLEMRDGKIFVRDNPSISVAFEKATASNLFASFAGRPPVSKWTEGFGRKLDTMNVAFCEVAVDPDLGEVEILRFGVVADPGKVLRPISLESQIDQVLYFSEGCQLLEEYIFDKRTGVKLNNNMIEYKKPGMLDIPPIDRVLLESRSGNAVYGASGISHSLANTHLIIIAIHNATGVWVDPPATPDKILRALGKV